MLRKLDGRANARARPYQYTPIEAPTSRILQTLYLFLLNGKATTQKAVDDADCIDLFAYFEFIPYFEPFWAFQPNLA